ncbi:MAG: hypothetical protein H6718_07885 [Polyangiaceae bacterium]|nr:hypothetical protein [Myxococcales bacterium]MCB9585302.1 hypothetical protein [Polyangiaceae bacterium]MCB9606681.1 hypothetical protein [Polyangiaceae bacterium]
MSHACIRLIRCSLPRLGACALGLCFALSSSAASAADDPTPNTTATDEVADAAPPPQTSQPKGNQQSPWDYSGEIGVPKLASNDFKLVGGGQVGYRKETWGIAAELAFASYATSSDQAFNSTSRNSFGVNGLWALSEPHAPTQLSLQGELKYASYATVYIPIDTNAGDLLSEFSGMSRLSALLGVERQVDPSFALLAAVGVGFQNESYSASSDSGIEASTSGSARFLGRVGADYALMPGTVGLRLRSELSYASVTRTQFAVNTDDLTAAPTPENFKLIEANNRLFGDLEMASFAGIVPNVFVGLDVFAMTGDAGSTSTLIPLAGVGLSNW